MIEYQTSNPIEQEILDFMKGHPQVTSKDIAQNCSAGEVARLRAFRSLRRAGVIRYVCRDGAAWIWSLYKAGDIQKRAAVLLCGRNAAIWTSMRVLGVFTPEDIQMALAGAAVEVSLRDIQAYCSTLAQSKYLTVLVRAKPGARSARYRLVKNTGPLPPHRKRMSVLVDPNEGRIVFANGERL